MRFCCTSNDWESNSGRSAGSRPGKPLRHRAAQFQNKSLLISNFVLNESYQSEASLKLFSSFSFSLEGRLLLKTQMGLKLESTLATAQTVFSCILHLVKCLVWTRPAIPFKTYLTKFGGTAKIRGSIHVSYPAGTGSIINTPKNYFKFEFSSIASSDA